jgi:hypothetical protein
VSTNRRLDNLERRYGGDDERMVFRIVVPPPGLTAAEHARWSEERRKDAEARGESAPFTLNLCDAVIQ